VTWPRLLEGVVAFFVACAATGQAQVEMSEKLRLTEQNDGQSVEVHVGEAVTVSLPENATTGYRWAVEEADASVVEVREGQAHYTSGAVGSGGRVEWIFLPKAPGTTLITLKQWRPWEGASSIAERYRFTLRVVP
jgi:inhibitor of cysteine peptidase